MSQFERVAAIAAWLVNTFIYEQMMPPSQRFGFIAHVCMLMHFDRNSFAANLVAEVRGKRVLGAHPSLRNSVSNMCAASCLDFSKCGYTTIA